MTCSKPIATSIKVARALAAGWILSACFSLEAIAGFTPPPNRRAVSGHRTTTGTRQGSCVGDSRTAFTLLGPDASYGQTTASRPEFVWHLPNSDINYTVQFRLLTHNEQGIPILIHTDTRDYEAGFSKYTLPSSVAPLSQTNRYRWQVVVVCDPSRLSRSLSQELFFEVVPVSAALQQALAEATTDDERALAYGEAGVWYDAIAQVSQSNNRQAQTIRQTLLRDLASAEPDNELFQKNVLGIAEASAQ